MDVAEGSSVGSVSSDQTIQIGHTLLLKMPTGDVRPHKLEKDTYAHFCYWEPHTY